MLTIEELKALLSEEWVCVVYHKEHRTDSFYDRASNSY